MHENVIRLHGSVVHRWCGTKIVVRESENPSLPSCVSSTIVGAKMQQRQMAAIFTCDGDNFLETLLMSAE